MPARTHGTIDRCKVQKNNVARLSAGPITACVVTEIYINCSFLSF